MELNLEQPDNLLEAYIIDSIPVKEVLADTAARNIACSRLAGVSVDIWLALIEDPIGFVACVLAEYTEMLNIEDDNRKGS